MFVDENIQQPNQRNAIPTRVNSSVTPRFRVERMKMGDQIDEDTGLPKYRTVEMVDLLVPGDQKSIPSKRVTPELIKRFKHEYDAWKASKGTEQSQGNGLPLRHWPQMPPEIAMGLAHANIFTVEQLAQLSDTQCNVKGALGLRKYRDMAKAFVDSSLAAAPIAKLAQDNEAMARRVELLERQLKDTVEAAEAKISDLQQQLGEEAPDLSQPASKFKKGKGS